MSDMTSIGLKRSTYNKLKQYKITLIQEKQDSKISFSDVIEDLIEKTAQK